MFNANPNVGVVNNLQSGQRVTPQIYFLFLELNFLSRVSAKKVGNEKVLFLLLYDLICVL